MVDICASLRDFVEFSSSVKVTWWRCCQCYQNILWSADKIEEEQKLNIRTKFLNCFKNYKTIKTPYEYKEVVKKLSKTRISASSNKTRVEES